MFDLPKWQFENGTRASDPTAIFPSAGGGTALAELANACATGAETLRRTTRYRPEGAVRRRGFGGAQALGRSGATGETGLRAGARADIVVLDARAPVFAGHGVETFIDAWVSGNLPAVTDVHRRGTGGNRRASPAGTKLHPLLRCCTR